jgi:hypothetical protein
MAVIPDLGGRDAPPQGTLGIFVAANSVPGGDLVLALPERILAEYFRSPHGALGVPQAAPSRVQEYVGQYRSAQRSYTQFEKILSVGGLPVRATQDGHLVIALGGESLRLMEIGKDLFRQSDGDTTIAFLRDERGAITHAVTPLGTLERVGFFMSAQWLSLVLVAALLTCVGLLIAAALRREPVPPHSIGERRSVQVMIGIATSWLLFLLVAAMWAVPFLAPQGQDQFIYSYPQPMLKAALAVGVVATGLSVLGVATLVPVWRERTWPIGRRLRHTAAVALFVVLVATLLQWNAIGFRYF